MQIKLAILLVCLLVMGSTQTTGCAQSQLPNLQTGLITLNPNDLGATGTNKIYYESLSQGGFGTGDLLGTAFAIAGFETSCSQPYYYLNVDIVEILNSNTQMRITISFVDSTGTRMTTWTAVKLSYLVVSSNRFDRLASGTTVANIWATSAVVSVPSGGITTKQAILVNDVFQGIDNGCGLIYSAGAGYRLNIFCDTLGTGIIDHDITVHSYIMGFNFVPTSTGTSLLAATVNWNSWMTANTQKQLAYESVIGADRPTLGPSAGVNGYGIQVIYGGNSATTANGPYILVPSYGGSLTSIKVAFVFTVVSPAYGTGATDNGYNSIFTYSYSGIYTVVNPTTYNILTLMAAGNYNNMIQRLPLVKYGIYGLSSFNLASSSGCSSFHIDVTLNTPNSFTLGVNNNNYVNSVVFQGDLYFASLKGLCSQGIDFASLYYDLTSGANGAEVPALALARKNTYTNLIWQDTRISESYSTVPTNSLYQSVTQISDNPLDMQFLVNGITGDNTTVSLNAQVVMGGLITKPYAIRMYLHFKDTTVSFGTANYTFNVQVNGQNIYQKVLNGAYLDTLRTSTSNAIKEQAWYGLNLVGTNATFSYNLQVPRNTATGNNYNIKVYVDFFQIGYAYDTVSQCCLPVCPANTGLDASITPPICVSCDISKGLTYNPSTGACGCAPTFYMNPQLSVQCFPCQAPLCSVCSTTLSTTCITCLNGATLNALNASCSCQSGFYQNNNTCATCPAKCATCSVGSICNSCSDSNRDPNNNCSCVTGYYDSGVALCQKCNPSCATCSNLTTCVTCDARQFRVLSNNICVCQNGFFELIYANGTKACQPCSAECLTCSQSAVQCVTCDSTINRVQGYDNLGHQTCVCQTGYYALPDASCVQSNCNADPYCSQCEADLALCVQCRATLNRVLQQGTNRCVCANGYYQDKNNNCSACSVGCAQCNSSTSCTTCVALATNNGDGTCTCASGTFFSVSSNGVRYCQQCPANCNSCSNALTCNVCQTNYVLSASNTCICPVKFFVNPSGNCVPCKIGCDVCTSNTTCTKCTSPLVVQQNNCIAQCSSGYFLSGSTCIGCPSNCQACTSTNQCFYCKTGFFLQQGSCYTVCPSGTVADNNTYTCVPCNSPCQTCANHPSSCTSCQPGGGYLATTGANQQCVQSCSPGTYPSGNVCQVCDFTCAQCLGASNNCVACAAGLFLYNGACWTYCPGIAINNTCVSTCPAGYYKQSNTTCQLCATGCATCDNNSTCLTCSNNYLSKNGNCVADCGSGYYTFRGLCVACDKSCGSCQTIPTNCLTCATGYFRSNSQCVASCSAGSYLDSTSGSCTPCSSSCSTCSSATSCLTCPNAAILPVGGQCYSCIYPCQTCSADLSVCKACQSGFYLSGGQCVRSCPAGTNPVNGACTCTSGIIYNGNCVASCPSGFTASGSTCVTCSSPCTSCIGSATFCTGCLDGYTLNVNTGVCSLSSQCNFGQAVSNGNCVRICDANSYYQNGACIFGGCPTGLVDNGFGGCVTASTTTSPSCISPTFKLNGVCVNSCGNGFFPNTQTRTCDACQANCQSCLNNNYCLTCSNGYSVANGNCNTQSSCTSTQFSYNGACVSSCPVGTYTNSGACARSCQNGAYYYGGWCYDTCPTDAQYQTDNACVATCPTGTTLVSGVCTTIV